MSLPRPSWAESVLADVHSASYTATLYPVTGAPIVLPITAGTLTVDSTRYPRTTVDLAVGDMSLAPRLATDPLTPFGPRLTLDYTLRDASGTRVHTMRVAPTLIVDTVEVNRGASVGIRLTASDPSIAVSTDTYPAATDPPVVHVSALIEALIRRTFPTATVVDDLDSTRWVGSGYQLDGSPWELIESLADTIGAECYVAVDNAFRVRSVPPIAAVETGKLATGEGGTITSTRSTLIRGYNRVALTFRGDDGASVVGLWADRSSSVVRVSGPYGRVTLAETRDRAATQAEADDAAARYARRVAGKVRDLEVEAVGAPWNEPGDTMRVTLPSGSDLLVLVGVSHDLTGLSSSVYRFRTDTLGPV